MKNIKLNATKLRIILLVVILVILTISIVSFFFVQQNLYTFAKKINASEQESDSSNITPQKVSKLKAEMSNIQNEILKSSNITIPIENYQTQAINDLKKYANDTGIIIDDDYSFSRPTSLGVSTQLIAGNSQTQPVNITIANPVDYASFIKFLKLVETNLPKMQLTGINVSRVDGSGTQINVEPLIIEVYTR